MGEGGLPRHIARDGEGRAFIFAIAALFALGVVLRVTHLFDEIRLDEATTYLLFAARPFGEAVSSYELPNNHILNTILVKLSVAAFGPEPWSLRLPALFAGLGAMALVAVIGRRWFGRAGAVAGIYVRSVYPGRPRLDAPGRNGSVLLVRAATSPERYPDSRSGGFYHT